MHARSVVAQGVGAVPAQLQRGLGLARSAGHAPWKSRETQPWRSKVTRPRCWSRSEASPCFWPKGALTALAATENPPRQPAHYRGITDSQHRSLPLLCSARAVGPRPQPGTGAAGAWSALCPPHFPARLGCTVCFESLYFLNTEHVLRVAPWPGSSGPACQLSCDQRPLASGRFGVLLPAHC